MPSIYKWIQIEISGLGKVSACLVYGVQIYIQYFAINDVNNMCNSKYLDTLVWLKAMLV